MPIPEPKVRELPLPKPVPKPEPEPQGKPEPPYKLASTRFTACEDKWEDERLCDYAKEEGERYCKLHLWMRKHPRT